MLKTISAETQRSEQIPTVWHVGREGEVAGGMTQVINAYLNWNFEYIKTGLIRSRDGTKGLRALGLFASALAKVLFMGSKRNNLVVVHLSQKGSFIREGLILLAAKARGLSTVAQLHGSSFVQFSERAPQLVRVILTAANKIHVLSEKTQGAVQRFVSSEKTVYFPNAVFKGQTQNKEKLIVFGGAVSHRKGVDVLMAAWEKLQPTTDWQLIVAGPLTDQDIHTDGYKQTTFCGAISHSELMNYLNRAHIAVLPSRDEAMPMFILEAMARRCCVISTSVGGIPKVLGEKRGIIVEPGNIKEFEKALDRAVKDQEYRDIIAQNGHDSFMSHYSAEAIYPQLEAFWLRTLKAGV